MNIYIFLAVCWFQESTNILNLVGGRSSWIYLKIYFSHFVWAYYFIYLLPFYTIILQIYLHSMSIVGDTITIAIHVQTCQWYCGPAWLWRYITHKQKMKWFWGKNTKVNADWKFLRQVWLPKSGCHIWSSQVGPYWWPA